MDDGGHGTSPLLRETKTISAPVGCAAAPIPSVDLVNTLCRACALCCNGVLFADVRLQAGDDVARLTELGVPLKRRGAVARFSQPCACLDGKLCRIYADRPARCRTFECRLLKRALAGDVTERA